MKTHFHKTVIVIVALSLALTACEIGAIKLPFQTGATPGTPPVEITGAFTYSNDIITTYYVEQAVALVDMYGFVKRDKEWKIPVPSQTLGFLSLDPEKKTGKYSLQLPAQPGGLYVNVSNDGKDDKGVQIFTVAYWPNLAGGPYSEGDDPSQGWPNYLASVVTDTENEDEVIGGNLVVWAPDGSQQFPTTFGADKKLFTADDPVGPIPSGYSIVNLDKEPFTVTQEAQPKLALFEPKDAAIKDFSIEAYTQAFDDMFAIVKKEYAFNDIEGKHPDWDKLYNEIKPRIETAESKKDAPAYYQALRDFTWAFRDGHVGISGDLSSQDFQEYSQAGYGFAIRELDDGKALVIFVTDGGPAAKAGMKVGAEVTEFNGQPIQDAISTARPYGTQSSDFAFRYQQTRYLLRAAPGTEVSVTFTNPKEKSQTAKLTAAPEIDSFRRTSVYYGVDTSPMLPVESKLIRQGNDVVGYVSINSNYDDLNLVVRLFQRALDQFKANKVKGIIIDMRHNAGGANLGLAGFLTTNEIPMGQLEYYSDKTGKFEPEGPREKVTANVEQYSFDKMILLVGQACYSACELEAYGFSQVPGMIVMGQTPTAGVEAEVARGQFLLPENLSLQVPTGRFKLPDGSIFLDGTGVPPTVKVPVDETTVLSGEDVILTAAQDAILKVPGKGITPSAAPKIEDKDGIQAALDDKADPLESLAKESYTADEMSKMDSTFTYTIVLNQPKTVLWQWGWCAKDKTILDQNFEHIKLAFNLAGTDVPLDQFQVQDQSLGGQACRTYVTALTGWQGGENHLSTTVTFDATINDGSADYPAGKQVFDYTVYVQP